MRHSKAQEGAVEWDSQVGVFMQEVIKATVCALLLVRSGTLTSAFSNRTEALKTAIPGLLYLLQNNLQYVSVTYLDAKTYAVLYQLKTLTTALMSVLLLNRRLSVVQWLSLAMLTGGVAIVVAAQVGGGDEGRGSILRGVAAVLLSCASSGLAGVSFEKLLKGSSLCLWTRNLQLALYSAGVSLVGFAWGGHALGAPDELFRGFSGVVWASIFNNALGGLLIAVVIKYADNILKNFATSLSIILTSVVSVIWIGTPLTRDFFVGTSMVVYAVFLYGGAGVPQFLRPRSTTVPLAAPSDPGVQAGARGGSKR